MDTPTLSPWPNDPLSSILARAARNERANSLKLPDLFAVLAQLDATFRAAISAAQTGGDSRRLIPRILLATAYAGFLATTRLALSGQVVLAFMPMRGTIEASWYALHIFADPESPNRIAIWGHRDDDETAKKRCRAEFQISNARRTHEALDPQGAAIFQSLYDETIDYGAHPNPRGIGGPIAHDETPDGMTFTVTLLTDDPGLIAFALQKTLDVGVGALKTFQVMFRDEFRAATLDADIDRLIDAANATFQAWIDRPRT